MNKPTKPPRRVVQITTLSESTTLRGTLYALLDDGSVWGLVLDDARVWYRVPGPPGTE